MGVESYMDTDSDKRDNSYSGLDQMEDVVILRG